ncbi:hypothetical protein BO70DRAFT_361852 [Aspergillus heteromorphus CBS 117.55]|uniref:Uncharacterized protein n=1 Tax=Aspergillus heteromorphus CBS 117.55 TaxID=1448321 RepID=A0A317W8I0_9EURO|nr:uncharacterized protein BO70DRAFT_361852 [Aspergillus heteromorphus CBS 117.55]PWY82936.1 hypothetical protein BO70DRAFT_361852 [Aspergillus heteromorphus CBS 117.55]
MVGRVGRHTQGLAGRYFWSALHPLTQLGRYHGRGDCLLRLIGIAGISVTDGINYRSLLSTWSSVSVVVSSSPPSRLLPPSTTARSPSAASATPVFPLVPPTAARRSADTPTSSAPRRSSSERF